MSQILNELKGFITPDLISKAASQLGENETAVSKGITSMIPALLGGMVSKSNDASAFSSIFNLIKGSGNANVLNNLSGLLGGGNSNMTTSLLSMLFGNKSNSIISSIASMAGLKNNSANSLLSMVSPMIMGYLSKLIQGKGLNAAGFASLLGQEKQSIMNAIPGGLGTALGLGNMAGNVSDTIKQTAATAQKSGSSLMRWALPLVLIAGLGYLAYSFFGKNSTAIEDSMASVTETVTDAAKDVTAATANVVNDGMEAAGDMVAGLGDFFSRKLANGVELNIPERGVENQLLGFIEDDAKVVDKTTWFNFDRLTFETGKANLDIEKSGEQLNNIVAIMNAYPNTKIKIGGYTDNTGNPEFNMNLSQARAEAVKVALQGMGIAADRIDAEGYGDAHPVASNDTEEGRAQNRRIAARFTAK